jgi:hypothetical protein
MGLVGDIIVGIVGAFIGGFVLSLLLPGAFGLTGFNLGSLVVAFIGAPSPGVRAASVARDKTSGEVVTGTSQPLRFHPMVSSLASFPECA